jgi:hypothetical protein
VRALRRRVSESLLREGATLALDRRDMDRKLQASGRRPGGRDLQVLAMLDLISALAIRLGMLILPKQAPAFAEVETGQRQ